MIIRFLKDIKKYYRYAIRSAKATLKAEVSGSYLNWLWWILNPICFMLIYAFIFGVVFNAKEKYFPIFIFIGLSMWDFFNHTILNSVNSIKRNRDIVRKVYLPKFVLIISDMMVNGFKMFISFGVTATMMVIYGIKPSVKMLYFIPIIITLFLVTFACACFVLHIGVFIQDLSNIIAIILRLLFYFTGIFYDPIKRIPSPYNYWVIRVNPIACLIVQARNVLLYGKITHYKMLLLWFLGACIVSYLGIRLIYKNENTYVKVS